MQEVAFWSKVDTSGGRSACWPWKACKDPNGYGRFMIIRGRIKRAAMAHRVAAQLTWGLTLEKNERLLRLKTCVPSCCNPSHFLVGDSAKFWDRVDQSGGPKACWEWTGRRTHQNYGLFDTRTGQVLAHRFAMQQTDPRVVVRHLICDNPPCCNPAHLALGTIADNNHDMADKGRAARGEQQRNAKLTEETVREIRARRAQGDTLSAIARATGVSLQNVHCITTRKTWKHVP